MEKKELTRVVASGAEIKFVVKAKIDNGERNCDGLIYHEKKSVIYYITLTISKGGKVLLKEGNFDQYTKMGEYKGARGFMVHSGGFVAISNADDQRWFDEAFENLTVFPENTEVGRFQAAEKAEETAAKVAKAEETVKKAESQKEIFSAAEIVKMKKEYNRKMNDGGDGYIPDFGVSREEYESAKAVIAKNN